MIKLFNSIDKSYISNGDKVIIPTKAKVHKEDNGAYYLDLETNLFKNNGGNYIGHFSGHQHHDFLDNLNNIPQITNLNDGKHWRDKSYWGEQANLVGDSPLKISGTTNECAFDAVIVNKTTRHVNLIRIGAGSDREFNY